MKVSIDTNAYRAFTDGNPNVVDAVQKASDLALSVVVLGELRAGFKQGSKSAQNEEILRRIISNPRVRIHEITDSSTLVYASIWTNLRKRGLPIPTNDLWIAAQCIEMDFALLTLDAHFNCVEGLRLALSS